MSTESDESAAPRPGPGPSASPVARLRAELDHAGAQLQRLEKEYADVLDDPGVIQEDRDATRSMLDTARRNCRTAAEALEQVESATYGRCVECDGPIGAERMEALSGVTMCVTCQARH